MRKLTLEAVKIYYRLQPNRLIELHPLCPSFADLPKGEWRCEVCQVWQDVPVWLLARD